MKIPICTFDAKTGILCPKCESRLKTGHLTQAEVDVSFKLAKIADKYPNLEKVTIHRAVEVGGQYVLVVGPGDSVNMRKNGGAVVKQMEEELDARLWLIEGEASDRKMLEDLFYPVRILTVNQVWLPDGSKLTKVIIQGRSMHAEIDIEKIKEVVKAIRGIDLMVEFEKPEYPVRGHPRRVPPTARSVQGSTNPL